MIAPVIWQRSVAKDVHSFARLPGWRQGPPAINRHAFSVLIEIAKSEKRVGSRRRDGWHIAWYFRIDGGPWVGDASRPTSKVASIAKDERLGFTTMRRAKAAALIGAAS